MMHMQVLLPGGKSPADMSFFFIHIQNLTCLTRKRRVDLTQSIRYILMHRTLADSKLFCRLTYCCFCFYYVMRNLHCTLFDIILQRKNPPKTPFLQCMRGIYVVCLAF